MTAERGDREPQALVDPGGARDPRPLPLGSISFIFMLFLSPANEVWGKVICLHLSVILSTGGSLLRAGMVETATAAAGRHPPGMHSCFQNFV